MLEDSFTTIIKFLKKQSSDHLSISNFKAIVPFLELHNLDLDETFLEWNICQLKSEYSNNDLNKIEIPYIAESMLRCGTVEKLDVSEQLEWIRNVPQHEQRTPEWFVFRQNLLSASSLSNVFKSDATRKSLRKEKVSPSKYRSSPATEFGNRFEPIAQAIYEKMTDTTISEYGCIKHKNIDHIGASPDGIVTDATDKSMIGRMLEIKCLYSRKLTGLPKYDYWVQVQMQLEVCELEYCDFFECKLKEFCEYETFIDDIKTNDKKYEYYGCFVKYTKSGETKPVSYYSEMNLPVEDFESWYNETSDKCIGGVISFIGWGLTNYSCQTIRRNRKWFESKKEQICEFWKNVLVEKENFKNDPYLYDKKEVCLIEDDEDDITPNIASIIKKKSPEITCLIDDDEDEEVEICISAQTPQTTLKNSKDEVVCLIDDDDDDTCL